MKSISKVLLCSFCLIRFQLLKEFLLADEMRPSSISTEPRPEILASLQLPLSQAECADRGLGRIEIQLNRVCVSHKTWGYTSAYVFLSTCFDYQHSILMLVSQKPFRSHRGLPKKVSNSLEAVLGHRGLQKHGCTLVNLQRCIDQVGNSEIAIGLFSSFTSNFTSRKLTQIRRDTYMYIYIYMYLHYIPTISTSLFKQKEKA